MTLKIQYNKTFLQQVQKMIKMRENALPTLKSKESALRVEVQKVAKKIEDKKEAYNEELEKQSAIEQFWVEFPPVITVKDVRTHVRNIAGVRIPILDGIDYDVKDVSFFNNPAWLLEGMERLKNLIQFIIEIEVLEKQLKVLDYARKKTTQKVNLYEKVQIPAFREMIIKIKRFLEDEDNISKAAQKIVKERNKQKEAQL